MLHTKTIRIPNPYFVSHYVSSLIPSFKSPNWQYIPLLKGIIWYLPPIKGTKNHHWSNVENRSFTIEHNDFRDRRCVRLFLVAEHFLKGQMHGNSDSSLVVLWWSDCLRFRLDWFSGKPICLSGALLSKCEQTYCNKEAKLCTKAGSLCLFIRDSMLSLIPWLNSQRNSQEGMENWEDSEFDQFKSCTQGPDFSCQALAEGLKENSTLKNLNLDRSNIGPEGAKAWCLVRMVGKKRA